jgi:hypothetical protein
MRRHLLTIGFALLAGTACRGVRPAAPALPLTIGPDSTDRTLSLSELCVEHPHALTLLADRCGFVMGTPHGALAARHPDVARRGYDDVWLPSSTFEPKHVPIAGRKHRTVSLSIMTDSLVPFMFEGSLPAHYTMPTSRAPLVAVTRSDAPADTAALRTALIALEHGVHAAGGVLIDCRRPITTGAPGHDWRRHASWRVGHDVVTLSASLDTVQTLDTVQVRWAIARRPTFPHGAPEVEHGCVTPARADWAPFVRIAAIGYETPLRAWFRLRTLAGSCEVTRQYGTANHPRCVGVPPIEDFAETIGPDGLPTGARPPRPRVLVP